ncbi:MAG: ATP-binding protein [Aridibacter sp.]
MIKLAKMKKSKPNTNKKADRKPPWFLGGFVLILLTFLVILQSSNIWKNLSVNSAGDTLLLYGLSSLNFIAFIIFAFILIRSLLKLRQERRAFQLGSKVKTRLVVYFAAVTLLPIIAMAVFSYLFMNRALDRWFTQIPENVVREAGQLQSRNSREQVEKFRQTTAMLANVLDGRNVTSEDLQQLIQIGNLAHIEIISDAGNTFVKSSKNLDESQNQQLAQTLSYIHQQKFKEPTLTDSKGFDIAKAKMSGGRMLITVVDMSSAENLNQIAENSLLEFDRLKSDQGFVRQIGLTTLGLLTFLLIFASSWAAFYIAKGLTRPIRALAEGADEIARGNLSHRVDVFAEDELNLLVKAFNEMSAKLEENSAELEDRRKYIETVLQSLSTGVISFDDRNHVTTINKAAIQMFKLEDADFAKFKLNQLVNKENTRILETLISRAKRIGQAAEQTVLQREYADGSAEIGESLPVALTATALPDKNGVVLVIEDLSELIAAQRATAWQEVARRMAHEIKNPLTPIQLSAERIAKRFASQNGDGETGRRGDGEIKTEDRRPKTEDQTLKIIKDGTDTILREVSSLKYMVDEFSRYARLPDPTLKQENLNEIIRQAALLYEDRTDDVKIEINLPKNLPKTMIDEEQLKRVFVNLIDNSFEAFEESATDKVIFIKTFHDSARDLIVAEVADNGRGIEPSSFQKLFQPYFSTKGRGTGLGLAIVQRIVSEHGGKIKVVANTPKGAKFIVELPVNM